MLRTKAIHLAWFVLHFLLIITISCRDIVSEGFHPRNFRFLLILCL
jgi:hypothetical protein